MPATQASQAQSDQSSPQSAASTVKFRFAVKTALSLTLAYLIPLAMGWPQPQTAATTVMLIAATGMLSESLQKGVLRIMGTIAGAVIGLSLIALFPQERLLYLIAASLVISVIFYLYNAYQGDSTLFMLAAVVTLMVFNGGNAEGAFIYGVDRAFMTVFGVLVYTVVASLLWPVKTEDNTHKLAEQALGSLQLAFSRLVSPPTDEEEVTDSVLTNLIDAQEKFQQQLAVSKKNRDALAAYQAEWNTIASCYQELESLLVAQLSQPGSSTTEFEQFITDYPVVIDNIGLMFKYAETAWHGSDQESAPAAAEVTIIADSLQGETHLTTARVASRMELLQKLQKSLAELNHALDNLIYDASARVSGREPTGHPAFLWLDLENFKTAVRAFVTFWFACGIWIGFNPPGGFTFVTLCTILVPLVSYTPVTPKLLIILFTLGFVFAVPAYVFLLPGMTHWLELAAFLFAYAFLGFYVLKGPVSIFFLLGLFTLGIQNTMVYNFNALMLTILMFYMICTLLIVSVHFPFTSRPERVFASLRRRFFLHCGRVAMLASNPPGPLSPLQDMRIRSGNALLGKMQQWGAMIDSRYFSHNKPEYLAAFNRNCEILQSQLLILYRRADSFRHNPLIHAPDRQRRSTRLARLCSALADGEHHKAFENSIEGLDEIEQRLNEHLGEDYLSRFDPVQLAQFYVYLNLQVSVLEGLRNCRESQKALDLEQLGYTKF